MLIELVGVAGAGKTTLLRALAARDETLRLELAVAKVRYPVYLSRHCLNFAADYWRHYRNTRWFSREEHRAMIYLQGWFDEARRLRKQTKPLPVTLLDHGPVYRLARLMTFGPELTRGIAFSRWWQQQLENWAQGLNAIVWLDTDDEQLLQRIRLRQQDHIMKQYSDDKIMQFLQRYRIAYADIITRMSATNRQLKLICLDSGIQPVGELATAVSITLDRIDKR